MKTEAKYLTFLNFFNSGFSSGLLLLLPFITRELHLSLTQAGALGGVGNVAKIFLSLPIVIIAGRIGGFKTLLIAIAVYGLGFLFTSMGNSFWLLLSIFLLSGVGFGVFVPVSYAIVTRITPKEHLGRVMGVFTSTSDLGRTGLAALLAFLSYQLGWREVAFLSFIVTIGLFLFAKLRFPIDDKNTEVAQRHPLKTLKHLMHNYRFIMSTLVAFFDSIASTSLYIFLPFLLLYKGLPANLLAIFISIYFIGGFVGKVFLGKLSDKFANTTVFIACEVIQMIFIFLLASVGNFYLMGICALILGMLSKGTVPAAVTMASQSVMQHETFEEAYAFNFTFIALANALTPIMMGYVADHSNIVYSFYLCGIAALIATIPAFLFYLRSQHQRQIILAEEAAQ